MKFKLLIYIFIIGLLVVMAKVWAEGVENFLYENESLNFSVFIPKDYQKETVQLGAQEIGLELKKGEEIISILASFESKPKIKGQIFVSDYGISGYKISANSYYLPVYIPLIQKQKVSAKPPKYKYICIDYSGKDVDIYKDTQQIAKSFRYLDKYKVFLRKRDNGKEFVFTAKGIIKLSLPSNPTTGFDWYFDEFDSQYFKIFKSGYTPSLTKTKRVGSGGVSWWDIIPLKTGELKIRLLYYRPWEAPERAVDKFEVRALIK